MKKQIKKLILITIISILSSSCEKLYRCDIPPKNISTLSVSIDDLNNAPEKLNIDGKTIESTYSILVVSDNRAIPELFGNKGCERFFTIKLIDSGVKNGLFKDYSFEYYWVFSREAKQSFEGNKVQYSSDQY